MILNLFQCPEDPLPILCTGLELNRRWWLRGNFESIPQPKRFLLKRTFLLSNPGDGTMDAMGNITAKGAKQESTNSLIKKSVDFWDLPPPQLSAICGFALRKNDVVSMTNAAMSNIAEIGRK